MVKRYIVFYDSFPCSHTKKPDYFVMWISLATQLGKLWEKFLQHILHTWLPVIELLIKAYTMSENFIFFQFNKIFV